MDRLRIEVSAKINLGLTVFGKKEDGYHDIEGIFQNVGIADILELTLENEGRIVIDGDLGCPPSLSTVFKAAELFFSATRSKQGAYIRVDKHIPSGAGLGGASADAAAVLVGLNLLCNTQLSESALRELAAEVASDVPFFISGGTAIVRGRGEIVSPMPTRTDFGVLVAKPRWSSATVEAYRVLDQWRIEKGVRRNPLKMKDHSGRLYSEFQTDHELVQAYYRPLAEWNFVNDFLPALEEARPGYRRIMESLCEAGAAHAGLTGSGSCLYGIFESKKQAEHAAAALKKIIEERTGNGFETTIDRLIPAEPLARSMNISYIQHCNAPIRSE